MQRQLSLFQFAPGLLMIILLNGSAAGQTFTTIDFPGGFATLAADINNSGQITGRYTDGHGFLWSSGAFTSVTVPGAVWTRAIAINSGGDRLLVERGIK